MYRSVGTDIYDRYTYFDENVIQGNLGGWFKEVVIGKISVEMPYVAMQYLISAGIKVIDKTGEYYRLPYWFKFVKGNTFTLYTEEEFNELPSGKEWNEVINNFKPKAQEPKQNYEIITCSVGGGDKLRSYKLCKDLFIDQNIKCVIHSVKRLSDNTTWTVQDAVGIGGYKTWTIAKIIETEGEIFADLEWSKGCSFTDTRCMLEELKKI